MHEEKQKASTYCDGHKKTNKKCTEICTLPKCKLRASTAWKKINYTFNRQTRCALVGTAMKRNITPPTKKKKDRQIRFSHQRILGAVVPLSQQLWVGSDTEKSKLRFLYPRLDQFMCLGSRILSTFVHVFPLP